MQRVAPKKALIGDAQAVEIRWKSNWNDGERMVPHSTFLIQLMDLSLLFYTITLATVGVESRDTLLGRKTMETENLYY